MTREVLISLGLVGWFVVLAVAEVATARGGRAYARSGDRRLFTNFGLTALNLLLSGMYPLATVTSAAIADRFGVGFANQIPIAWPVMLLLALLVQSFVTYWVHLVMHQTPLLWRVHRVHHSDSEVDVSTSLRNHPVELLVTLPVAALVTVALGPPVSVVVASQAIMLAAAIWQHADIVLPERVDHILSYVLVTPRLHRLHHNPVRMVHDTNFGELFTFWDRIFGTLSIIEGRGRVGLFDQVARPDRLLEQIWSPVHPA